MTVCRLADMPEGTARGFTLFSEAASRQRLDIIVWRLDEDEADEGEADEGEADEDDADNENARHQTLRGFVNKCPHLGLPLETFPDRFLDALGSSLICSAHGAQFDAQGHCFAGPCQGENLTNAALDVEMRDGEAFIVLNNRAE